MEKSIIQTIPGGVYRSNAYLICPENRDDAFLIDAGDGADEIRRAVRESGRKLTDILLTHGHFDHMLSAPALQREFGARVWIHALDLPFLSDAKFNLCDRPFAPFEGNALSEGEHTFCGLTVKVIHTPGHTPGGCSFLIEEFSALFSGDTLFRCGIGRTDFPLGSARKLRESLRTLLALDGNLFVYPGHEDGDKLSVIRGGFR